MDDDDLEPQRQASPMHDLRARDLTPLAIAELEAYIGQLEAEIRRVRDAIAAKLKQRGGAESLFKR